MSMTGTKPIATNRKAYHDYFIEDKFEAGIELKGTEVKSLRAGLANLKDSYCTINDEEAFIVGLHISPYEQGNIHNVDPDRTRKLLLHKREIRSLIGKTQEKGLTLIPTKLYFRNRRVKLEFGLAKGKQLHDKRRSLADKDAKREIERGFRERQKGDA
ncbi:MAG: SsrA-binding protein SmpB [Thermoleophilia bacterium]|nr:SsrA-binding protein SmpB [Thermoleophilia bacterium]